jgi:membrane protein insertase Oxa1/YidC/SpoIIIJ
VSYERSGIEIKTLIYSSLLCLVVCAIAFFIGGIDLVMQVSFGIGVVLLLLSMVFSGSLVSGDRIRANYHTSTTEDNMTRHKWTLHLLMMAVPFFAAGLIIYMIVRT